MPIIGPRLMLNILGGLAVAGLLGWFALWVHGKDAAIHRAQTQRAAAVLALVREQRDGITLRVNVSTLSTGIASQNASLRALGQREADTQRALDRAAREAVRARTRAERSAAALLAGRAGADPCRSAMDVARSLP